MTREELSWHRKTIGHLGETPEQTRERMWEEAKFMREVIETERVVRFDPPAGRHKSSAIDEALSLSMNPFKWGEMVDTPITAKSLHEDRTRSRWPELGSRVARRDGTSRVYRVASLVEGAMSVSITLTGGGHHQHCAAHSKEQFWDTWEEVS